MFYITYVINVIITLKSKNKTTILVSQKSSFILMGVLSKYKIYILYFGTYIINMFLFLCIPYTGIAGSKPLLAKFSIIAKVTFFVLNYDSSRFSNIVRLFVGCECLSCFKKGKKRSYIK